MVSFIVPLGAFVWQTFKGRVRPAAMVVYFFRKKKHLLKSIFLEDYWELWAQILQRLRLDRVLSPLSYLVCDSSRLSAIVTDGSTWGIAKMTENGICDYVWLYQLRIIIFWGKDCVLVIFSDNLIILSLQKYWEKLSKFRMKISQPSSISSTTLGQMNKISTPIFF